MSTDIGLAFAFRINATAVSHVSAIAHGSVDSLC
jgi:hypothetical protein